MGMAERIAAASDRFVATLAAGLEIEFGRGAGEAPAHRFLEVEEVDCRWDARVEERWIGAYERADDGEFELDRITCLGRFDRKWFRSVMLMDGNSQAHAMRCSMRTDREHFYRQRRRREAFVAPPFLSRNEGEQGREGKQDKGSVSRPCSSLCLHILFLRDSKLSPRDMAISNGGISPFSAPNRETREAHHA